MRCLLPVCFRTIRDREETVLVDHAAVRRWIGGVEIWGGMGYVAGLTRGNGIGMAELGFTDGVIGDVPPLLATRRGGRRLINGQWVT